MAINLKKGGNLVLDKSAGNLNKIQIGLGWNPNQDSTIKKDFDLDVFGLIVNADGKGVVEDNVVFYHNVNGKGLTSDQAYGGLDADGITKKALELLETAPLVVTKDNRSGQGEGDDETMYVNASQLAADKKIIIVINIYEAKENRQTFGMVSDVYGRVLLNGTEFCRYDLAEDFSIETGVVLAEIYWNNGELKVKALGKGFEGDVNTLMSIYA